MTRMLDRYTVSLTCPYCGERIVTIMARFRRPYHCCGCGVRIQVEALAEWDRLAEEAHRAGFRCKLTVMAVRGVERDDDPATGRAVGAGWFGVERDKWGRLPT